MKTDRKLTFKGTVYYYVILERLSYDSHTDRVYYDFCHKRKLQNNMKENYEGG